jgi:murein DD-endopeptidase MepM/ murein hydrolase activator NlpD
MHFRTQKLSSLFGMLYGYVRWDKRPVFHGGWDLYAGPHTPILAIGPGRVVFVGLHHPKFGKQIKTSFQFRGQILWTQYAHLHSVSVKVGDSIARGQELGETGCSGNADISAPHLHFEIHKIPDGQVGFGPANRIDPAVIYWSIYGKLGIPLNERLEAYAGRA